jgi:hypothetical protein
MAARQHPPRPSPRVLAVALSALALAIVGCGGGSDQEHYGKDVQAVNRDLSQLGRIVARAVFGARGKSNSQFRREFSGYADRVQKIQGDLARLHPPSRLSDEQDRLVSALRRLQRSLQRMADLATGKATLPAARQAFRELLVSSATVKAARQRLARDAARS